MPDAGGSEDERIGALEEAKTSLFRRIDAGLVTGVAAVVVSVLALATSVSQMRAYKATQQAAVMPIIDVDLAYVSDRGAPLTLVVDLDNVGVGVADIRSVRAVVDGERVAGDADGKAAFMAAVMSPNMRAWARVRDGEPVGYLRPGDTATPVSWNFENPLQARAGEYLSGDLGVPMAGADVQVCYCSVFGVCWTVGHLDRKPPERVRSCGVDGAPDDVFADWRAARLEASGG